jgi:hypothetical protein
VQVHGEDTITSDGFSVAAIPQNMTVAYLPGPGSLSGPANLFDPAYRGIHVLLSWESDSGDVSDLDEVKINEQIEVSMDEPPTGIFVGTIPEVGKYFAAKPGTAEDDNAIGSEDLRAPESTMVLNQTHEFLDRRTGVRDIPMTKSGYKITHAVYMDQGKWVLTTSKYGADTTANGIDSKAGSIRTDNGSDVIIHTEGPAIHYMITVPPTTVAGMPFNVTVTAVDAYGNVDTSYTGTITFSTNDSDPGVVLPPDYTFTSFVMRDPDGNVIDRGDNGVHTFSATLITAGDQAIYGRDITDGFSNAGLVTVSLPPPPGGGGGGGGGRGKGAVLLILPGVSSSSTGVSEAVGGRPAPVLRLHHRRVEEYFSMSPEKAVALRPREDPRGLLWELSNTEHLDVLDGIFGWEDSLAGRGYRT